MAKRGRPRHPDVLTPREWEVLSLLRENLTNEQIAQRLGVTLHAARYHVSEILSKLAVATREEAAAWQPEEVRTAPRWSIAFQVWLTAAAAVAIVGVGVLGWGISRGSGDDEQTGVIASASPTVTMPATASPAVSESPPPGFVGVERPDVGANVRSMQLVADTGIVLTDDALLRAPFIQNGERIDVGPPVQITPPGVAPGDIRGFHFLDGNNGWVAQITIALNGQFIDSNTVNILRTTDGGQTWQSSPITDFLHDDIFPGAYFDFLDSQTGWVVLKLRTNTAHSAGELFRTEDGGATWTKLSIPTGDPIYFTNQVDGWAAGGPIHYQLYATHDGGQTWTDASDITPLAEPAGPRAFGLPVALDDGSLLLPVTGYIENHPSLFMLYSSADGGQVWQPVAITEITDRISQGSVVPSYIFADGSVVAFVSDGTAYQLAPDATEFESFTPMQLGDIRDGFTPTGLFPIASVDFLDHQHAWALAGDGGCQQFKADCWQAAFIQQTEDGGLTWSPLPFGSAPTQTP